VENARNHAAIIIDYNASVLVKKNYSKTNVFERTGFGDDEFKVRAAFLFIVGTKGAESA
jgi:hypothetical protein